MSTGELRGLEYTKESVGIRLAWSPDTVLFSGEYFNLNLTSFLQLTKCMQLVIHNIRLDLYTTIHVKSTNPAQTFESDGTSSTSNSTVITCLKSRSPRDNSFPPRLYHRISSVSIRQDVCFQGGYKNRTISRSSHQRLPEALASVTCMNDKGLVGWPVPFEFIFTDPKSGRQREAFRRLIATLLPPKSFKRGLSSCLHHPVYANAAFCISTVK